MSGPVTITPALKNIQDDKPKEKEEQPLPSLFDGGILQHFEVGAGNELEPMTRTTRYTSRLAAYVIPEVYEPPSDDVLGPEGSSAGPAAVNTPAVRSKRAGSTGTPKTAKQRRVRESTSAATLAGEPRTQWDVSGDRTVGPLASGCSTSLDSQVDWIQVTTRTSPNETCRVRRGRGPVPLRDHGAAPTSPPGGVLRQLWGFD